MAALGLVVHVAYKGVTLTPLGERAALAVIRHHRLIELFLAEVLGMPWDRVHSEAEVLELGATRAEHQPGTTFRVFLDPAGHPFCLCLS